MEDIVDVPTSETQEVETVETVETEQDPLKTELERVQKGGRTEKEKAEFSLRKTAERLAELGGDATAILGIKVEDTIEDEDDLPVTKGELRKLMVQGATKNALQLAEDIEDQTEKELVKYYLENRIAPSGNPQEDLRDARRIVNSLKNEQIIKEAARKTPPKTHSNSSGVDAKQEQEIVLTADELQLMKHPFKMTKEQVLAARKGENYTFKN